MDKKAPSGENTTIGDVFRIDDLVAVLDAMEDLEKTGSDKPVADGPNGASVNDVTSGVSGGPDGPSGVSVDDVASGASGGGKVPTDGPADGVDGARALEFNIQIRSRKWCRKS